MSSSSATQHGSDGPALATHTLAASVLILLVMTGVQRLVGFGRAILFCRWLEPEQLGEWDMAFNFLMLAAPVSVLAMTGSFQRYTEHYRQRRQLRTLLRRTAVACAALACLAAVLVNAARSWFSELVFGRPDRTELVAALAGGLLAAVAFHYFLDLSSAFRNARLIAGLHLVNSAAFAALGILLLAFWQCSALSVVIAYGGSCTLAAAGGLWWLRRNWRAVPGDGQPPPAREFWGKVLSFAVWVWLTCVAANLFTIADRYMIVHHSPASNADALAQVGEYHTSRVLPLLLVSLAGILAPIVTAHLSHDWEAGRRHRVTARLNLFLKLFGFGLTAAGVLILLAAPILFHGFLEGKFAAGLAVLPWTLTYCVLFAMFGILQIYLWCCEKARLASAALVIGLAANVGLNLLLLPILGLLGAVLATVAANLVALVVLAAFNHRLGFRLDRGAWVVLFLPLVLSLGPWMASALLAAVVAAAIGTDRLLSPEERRGIKEQATDSWRRCRRFRLAWRSAGGGS
ncbi:MAG: lipopolysaccharide biosynthesis protein [Planctomycetota bacterium]|jgi:O-antigen/teichoic acid export membrane protein